MRTLTPTDNSQRALSPPQFSLRTLWAAMTLLCILLGAMTFVGLVWSTVLVLFLGLLVAHVVGNALGTRLRDGGQQPARGEQPALDESKASVADMPPVRMAPAECFRENTRISRASLLASLVGAAVAGGLGGTTFSASVDGIDAAGIGVGTASTAVIGAYAGLLASTFWSVWRRARREALRPPRIEQTPT